MPRPSKAEKARSKNWTSFELSALASCNTPRFHAATGGPENFRMRQTLVLTCLLCAASLAWAGNKPAAQQLLDTARRQSALFHGSRPPFALNADVLVQFDKPVSGHIEIRWLSEDRWWLKTAIGPYQETTVHDGENVHILRNLATTPQRIRELYSLLTAPESAGQFDAESMKERRQKRNKEICIRATSAAYPGQEKEIWVDSASNDILREEYDSFGRRARNMYTDYAEFNGVRYPRKLERTIEDKPEILIETVSIEAREFDPILLSPPSGAIERRDCHGKTNPVPLKTTSPDVLPRNGLAANATLAVTVEKDGSVSNVVAIGGSSHALDQVTIDAVKTWKFKPAMCGADPVVEDTVISMNYR